MTLREKILKQGKTRWLDVGCGRNYEEGFWYLDVFPKSKIPLPYRKRYTKADMRTFSKEMKQLGRFDLIRMQHVVEHLPYEEGLAVLNNAAKMLKKDGILLVTVPDLAVNVEKYQKNTYRSWGAFRRWAHRRIPKDAPASFYFSIFAYSLPITPHQWCYDLKGLRYLIRRSGMFKQGQHLLSDDPRASVPFTHNRPEEDVCVLAHKA